MSSTSDQLFDIHNLRMLDRILRKAGFRGGETYATDDGEISATSFLIHCFQMGIVDEAALKSALKMYLATQLSSGPLPQAMLSFSTPDGSDCSLDASEIAPCRLSR